MVASIEEKGLKLPWVFRIMVMEFFKGDFDLFLREKMVCLAIEEQHRFRGKEHTYIPEVQLLTHRHDGHRIIRGRHLGLPVEGRHP